MQFSELTQEQLQELAEQYLCTLADEGTFLEVVYNGVDPYFENEPNRGPSWGELLYALEIVPIDVLERQYGDVCFGVDDFFCSAEL